MILSAIQNGKFFGDLSKVQGHTRIYVISLEDAQIFAPPFT